MVERRLSPPPLGAVRGQLRLIHAALSCASLRPLRALRDLPAAFDPQAVRLFVRWALRRAWPGRFERVERQPLRQAAPAFAGSSRILAATQAA